MKQFISKDSETGIFYLYYWGADGKRKRKSLKTRIYEEAQKKITDPPKITFETSLNNFKNTVMNYALSNFAKGTCELYKTTLVYLLHYLGNVDLNSITLKSFEDFKTERLKFVKVPTVNTYVRILKSSFSLAVKWGLLRENPTKDFKKIKEDQKEKGTFTEDQFNRLIEKIENKTLKNICYFGYYTGARLSEIINLQWEDLDLQNKVMIIRNKIGFRTKSGKIRYIPISEKLLGIIHDMNVNEPSDAYLFQRLNKDKFSKDYASNAVRKKIRQAGLPKHLHFHCLRHTAITRMIAKGTPLAIVQKIAGHSNIATTLSYYTHLMTDDLRNAVNCL